MNFSNPGALIEQSIRESELEHFLASAGLSGTMLDLGCGAKPYYTLYSAYFEKCIGADLADSPFPKKDIDLHCSATNVPLPDNSLDFILCTEVLHDIAEPDAFFNELRRLLKPGGKVFLSSPFVVPIVDGEFDHYRYTEHGLRYRINKADLRTLDIKPVGDVIASCITLAIKPSLKIFSSIAKAIRFPAFYSVYNPLLFLTTTLPQLAYLLARKTPVLKTVLARFQYGAIGYISLLQKK